MYYSYTLMFSLVIQHCCYVVVCCYVRSLMAFVCQEKKNYLLTYLQCAVVTLIGEGCTLCECNDEYSYNNSCLDSGQCPCKPGIAGLPCDQCADG